MGYRHSNTNLNYYSCFKPFNEFTNDERLALSSLTRPRGQFTYWLRDEQQHNKYAVLLKENSRDDTSIRAWAAANLSEHPAAWKLGVFVQLEHRCRGLAYYALDTLLANLVSSQGYPRAVWYQQDKSGLFIPLLERFGLQDFYFRQPEVEPHDISVADYIFPKQRIKKHK